MKSPKTLILEAELTKKLVGIKEALNAIEDAFRRMGQAKTKMPAKLYLNLPQFKGDFRAMPAWVEGFKGCAIKWVNVHPLNKNKGLPTVMGIIILSDPATGFPLCVMDATHLTALRTGAAGGVAAKFLARKESRKVGLVGCGVQARTQLAAIFEIFNIDEVKVWGPKPKEIMCFINFAKKLPRAKKVKIEKANTIKDCVKDSDIIVTTTPSRKPLVRRGWIKEGVHINAIGADACGKQELDYKILKRAKVVVDDLRQASHSGEINVSLRKGKFHKKDIYADIGEVVAKRKKGRVKRSEITVFDSTGLAIQDVAIANIVYRKAMQLKKGKFVKFVS
ncbi:MAG: alanine dehydrogenase [Candidatus Omnitrophota bacterium]|nr:MAG: alanine dehydrogenase [Candidatus Omnitrophota bacterium]